MVFVRNKKIYDIAVIGGGPSGLFTAGRAAELGGRVVLIEKNDELGKKLKMTGKGRCNFTHYDLDKNQIVEKFSKNGRFLYSALEKFGVEEILDFYKSRGLDWKVERGNRVFPDKGNAGDILKILEEYLQQGKVEILYNSKVETIHSLGNPVNHFEINLVGQKIYAQKVVLCTGGKSYPMTGSTGDGYRWAQKFGHTVTPLLPALNPVRTSENWVKDLQGLTLKNVSLTLYQNGKKKDERFGEMLFTHFGISGPIVMDMSKNIGILLKKGQVKLSLDVKPALDFKRLDERIQRDFQEHKGKFFKNSLKRLLPASFARTIIQLSDIGPEKRVDHISREERNRLVHLLKELELTPVELLGYSWSVVTHGGISLKEVNPNTMESRITKNLYFAGEILDLDGPSGGYNLQVCWSTAFLAGESAVRSLTDVKE